MCSLFNRTLVNLFQRFLIQRKWARRGGYRSWNMNLWFRTWSGCWCRELKLHQVMRNLTMRGCKLYVSPPEVEYDFSRVVCLISSYLLVFRPWNRERTLDDPFKVIKSSPVVLMVPGIVHIDSVSILCDFNGFWSPSFLKEMVEVCTIFNLACN